MYNDRIEVRKHSLELVSSIDVNRINYFSSSTNSACNVYVDQENCMVFSLQKRQYIEEKQRDIPRIPFQTLQINTASKAQHRSIRRAPSLPRFRKTNQPKLRDKELIYPTYLHIHDFDPKCDAKNSEVRCEMTIGAEVEPYLTTADIKSEVTCIHYDDNEKSLYLATKKGSVFKFQ